MQDRIPFFPSILAALAGGAWVGYQSYGAAILGGIALAASGMFLWENRRLLAEDAHAGRLGPPLVGAHDRAFGLKLAAAYAVLAVLFGLIAVIGYLPAAWLRPALG